MKIAAILVLLVLLVTSAYGSEMKAFQIREDYGAEPLYDCFMQYYYTIPCPTSSWYWGFPGLIPGDILGVFFTVGDMSMSGTECSSVAACDPLNDATVEQIRVLDFAAYGTIYPGRWPVEFNIWCSDEQGCPVGSSLWSSGPVEFCPGWNYVTVSPPVCVTQCYTQSGPPPSYPRFLITATHLGPDACYPMWGMDNISTPIQFGCAMHDIGSCPALYPRPHVSHYSTMHTGFYGQNFMYCPPKWFLDGADTTRDGTMTGFIELAWTVYLTRSGPTAVEPSTWGSIKAIYR